MAYDGVKKSIWVATFTHMQWVAVFLSQWSLCFSFSWPLNASPLAREAKIRLFRGSKTPPMGHVHSPMYHIAWFCKTQNIWERERGREGEGAKRLYFHPHLQEGPNRSYWVEKWGDPTFCHAPKESLHSQKNI